jgi:two-component system chemotaxis response regulator CheB
LTHSAPHSHTPAHATSGPGRVARILIVDDSAVVRTLLRAVVNSDARLEVAGTAADGAAALQAMETVKPDLVLLDVEMPGMDGLSTLKKMRAGKHQIPVIMCSSLTQRGAKVTIEALASGAADYVAKPSGQSSRESAIQTLAQDLIPKILALTAKTIAVKSVPSLELSEPVAHRNHAGAFDLIAPLSQRLGSMRSPAPNATSELSQVRGGGCLTPAALNRGGSGVVSGSRPNTHSAHPASATPLHGSSAASIPVATLPHAVNDVSAVPPAIVVIGVSTGGPAALDTLLPLLPIDFPLAVLIVQHMPELFTSILAARLNDRCALHVREAIAGEPVQRGTVYIARGDWHLEVALPEKSHARAHLGVAAAAVMRLTQLPPENHCRPAVDVLFRSAAAVYGPRVLGIVLTGMGYDGLVGSRAIREQGGTIMAQDQASSAVWGMPGAVAQAGLAQRILPLGAIAPEILKLTGRTQREGPHREATVMP